MLTLPSLNDPDAERITAHIVHRELRRERRIATFAMLLAHCGAICAAAALLLWQFYDVLPGDRVLYMLPLLLFVFVYPVVMAVATVLSAAAYANETTLSRAIAVWLSAAGLVTWAIALYVGRTTQAITEGPPLLLLTTMYAGLTVAGIVDYRLRISASTGG